MKYIILCESLLNNQLYLILSPSNKISGFSTKDNLIEKFTEQHTNMVVIEEHDLIIVEFPGSATDLKEYCLEIYVYNIPITLSFAINGAPVKRSLLDFPHSSLKEEYTKHLQSLINS